MAPLVREQSGSVVRLRFCRPERLNSLTDEVRVELDAVFAELVDDLSVTVVVLEGEGRAFSAGADLGSLPTGGASSWAERRHRAGAWGRLLDRLEALPQVTVAALQGHCIGGAALVAVACDLRVADDTVKIRIPELALGIPLTWGGVPRLAREIGLPLTRDLVMTGRALEAEEALSCGFVQRLARAGQLSEAVDMLVGELSAMPSGPLFMTKAMTAALSRERMGTAAWADADLLAWSGAEPEGRAAASAYLEAQQARRRERDGG